MLNRPSNGLITRVVVLVGALLAISAMLLLSTNSQDVVLAHEPEDDIFHSSTEPIDHIHYSEILDPAADDIPAVQTFKSVDPESKGVYWDVTGVDADDFEIDPSSGVLRFKAGSEPDYEKAMDRENDEDGNGSINQPGTDNAEGKGNNSYEITIRATEKETPGNPMGRALSTEMDITVVVDNLEEKGEVMLQWLEPEVGTNMQAYLMDPDGGTTNTNVDFTWWRSKVGGLPNLEFDGHWEQIADSDPNVNPVTSGTTVPTTDFTPRGVRAQDTPGTAEDEGKYLRVVATYYDAEHTADSDLSDADDERKKAYGMAEYVVREERTTGESGALNKSPDFVPRTESITVSEDYAVGADVGSPVEAEDPNTDDHLTYELMAFSGTNPDDANANEMDVDFFDIDRATGQIMVAKKLDYDSNPSVSDPDGKYTIIVKATDPSGDSGQAVVTITAGRANDEPMITGASELRVNEQDSDDANGNGEPDIEYAPLTGNEYEASDEDRSTDRIRVWGLAGPDAALFRTPTAPGSGDNSRVVLKFRDPPNFEDPQDADRDNVYKVMLTATDNNGGMDDKAVTVFVDNVQEAGKVTLWTEAGTELGEDDSPVVGETLTALVVDPDEGVTVVTWQWFRSLTADGTYRAIIGETSASYTPMAMDAAYDPLDTGTASGVYLRARATYIDALTLVTEGDDPTTTDWDERVQEDANTPKDPDGAEAVHEGDERLYEAAGTTNNAVRATPPPDPGDDEDPTTQRPDPIECPNISDALMVVENAETGSFVGGPVMRCDGGTDDLTYTLHPATPDNNYFSITSGVGSPGSPGYPQITVGSSPKTGSQDTDPVLNYEEKKGFTVQIQVMDAADPPQRSSFSVPIELVNLNEVPFFNEASKGKTAETHPEAIEGVSNYDKTVATYVAIDPDDARNSSAVVWYVTGTDADDFEIVNGALMFMDPPDYEDPSDRGHDANNDGDLTDTDAGDDAADNNVYNITLRATEAMAIGGGPKKSAELDVTVTVEDRNEPGEVMLQWLQPEVGTEIMATVTDPDGEVTSLTWQWYQAKVGTPNQKPNPDPTTLGNEWVVIDVSDSNDGTATYTPQGDDADDATDDADGTIDEDKHLLALASYQEDGETRYAAGVSKYAVRADVADDVNGSPNFVGDKVTFELGERTEGSKGDTVGRVYVLPANVGDDDILTYSLEAAEDPNAADLDFFEIDKATGEVTVKKSLSFEADDGREYNPNNDPVTAGEYKFIVRATDPSGEYRPDETNRPNEYKNRDDIAVTVMALEENEFPKVTEGEAELTVDEADSTKKPEDPRYFVGLGLQLDTSTPPQQIRSTTRPNLYEVIDPDVDDTGHIVDVMGPDRGKLALVTWETDQPGYRLQFKDYTPNYEMPGDANGDNVYEVEIVVTNSSNNREEARMPVTVEVMNREEEGKVTLTPEQPSVATDADPAAGTVTATLTDDDLTADMMDGDRVHTVTYWQWYWTETDTGLVFNRDDDDQTPIDERDELDPNTPGQGKIEEATTSTYTAMAGDGDGDTGDIGRFLHAKVEYRDGYSVTDDPATPLMDERNDDLSTENTMETDFDSDEMLEGRTDNAVQTDPTSPTDPGDGTGPGDDPTAPPTMRTERLEVAENTPGTGYVGTPVDLTSGLTYVLAGTDGEHFVLADELSTGDANNRDSDAYASDNRQMKPGQIAVALSPRVTQLNAESDKSGYEVVLTGSDADHNQRDIITVEIAVVGVNEAPGTPEGLSGALEITGQDSVRRDEGGDSLDVATYIVVGGDAEGAIWQALAGADAGAFDFTDGVLTFKMLPDFEMPADAGGNNVYQVRLSATDAEGTQTFRKEVVVIIANKEEPGSVEVSTDMPQVGVELMAQNLMDEDIIDEATLTWQWARSDMMDGPWTDIDGATDMAYTPMESPEPEAGETKAPDDVEMFLQVTAMYEDGHGAGKSASEATDNAVGVMPDNEGMVTFSAERPVAGTPLTAMLTDADLPIEMLEWQWASSDAMDGTFTDITGATAASYTPRDAMEDDPATMDVDETYAGDVDMYLRATAMYNDSHGDDKSEDAVTANPVIVPLVCIEPLGTLAESETVMGTWTSDCMSEGQTNNYARYYSFTLSEETRVAIYLTSERDTYLYLRLGEGRTGRAEHQNNNLGRGNINSRIEETLAAGTYTVEATTYYRNGVTGDFTLDIRPVVRVQELETLTETYTTPGTWSDDFVSERQAPNYARYYRFTLDTPADLRIDLTSERDTYLYLVREDGTVVDENNDVGRSINSRIVQAGLAAGTYTVEATTYYRNPVTGNFVLNIGLTR